MLTLKCTLKRCQGKRGCICPIGTAIGTYTGKKIEVITNNLTKNRSISTMKQIQSTKHHSKELMNESKRNIEEILIQSLSMKDNIAVNNKYTTTSSNNNTISTSNTSVSNSDSNNQINLNDFKGSNGEVIIRYNHYKKKFLVKDGSTTSSLIDEQYYLSFVSNNI